MFRRGLMLASLIAVADQASKYWLLGWLRENGGFVEVTPFFNLVTVWNRGISFGMFQSGDAGRWVLVALTGVIAGVLTIWLWRARRSLTVYGIAVVLGGAVGNIIDRVSPRAAVADFFDFHVLGYHWPAFNIADSAITIGVGLILLDAFREGRQTKSGDGLTS